MFSPAKAITAGALVFALGGVLLIAQPFDQQGGSVPGAATGTMQPATFTADAGIIGTYIKGRAEVIDGVLSTREDFQMAVEATDPRVTGTLTYGVNREVHPGAKVDAATVHAGTVTIENEGGSWAGTFTGYWDEASALIFHAQLTGQDGYEGWTMLLDDFCVCQNPDAHVFPSVMQGVVIPGDLPPAE